MAKTLTTRNAAKKRDRSGFFCEHCGKVFMDIWKHRRTHTGERPFQCDICPQRFSRKQNLRTHRRTHTGDQPFQCDFCSQKFSRKYHMKEHQRTHTGEKPYKCDLCRLQFHQGSTLRKHRLAKHPANDANEVAPMSKARQAAAKNDARSAVGTRKAAFAPPVIPVPSLKARIAKACAERPKAKIQRTSVVAGARLTVQAKSSKPVRAQPATKAKRTAAETRKASPSEMVKLNAAAASNAKTPLSAVVSHGNDTEAMNESHEAAVIEDSFDGNFSATRSCKQFKATLSSTIASFNSTRLEDEAEDEAERAFSIAGSDEVSSHAEEDGAVADFDLASNVSSDVERADGQNGVIVPSIAPVVAIAVPARQLPLSPSNPLDIEEILAKIFGYLEPKHRLKASRVSRRWKALISTQWSNVKQLDASEVPPEELGGILQRCENIESLLVYPPASELLEEKQTRRLFLDHLARDLQQSLVSLKLYHVRLTCSDLNADPENRRPALLQAGIGALVYVRLDSLQELICHDVACLGFDRSSVLDMMFDRCRSLKRLQLTDCDHIDARALFQALRRLPHLECLALGCDLHPSCSIDEVHDAFEYAVTDMLGLRELCLFNSSLLKHGGAYTLPVLLPRFCNRLLQLEVLVVTDGHLAEECYLSRLNALPVWLEKHPKLRILLFSASGHALTDYNVVIEPRVWHANGLTDPPVSFLNAFIDGAAAGDLSYTPESPAGKIWPINEPMLQYLLKPEVKEIFAGSWTYEIIRSAAKLQIDLLQLFEDDENA